MLDQKKLERQIQVYSFAVYEAVLYLDGHPCDKKAIEYYNKYNSRLCELREQYEKRYGPLTINGNHDSKWKWTESAWPWEYESN